MPAQVAIGLIKHTECLPFGINTMKLYLLKSEDVLALK